MIALILRAALSALALLVVPEIVGSIQVSDYTAALIAALLLGIANALIRPLLVLLTLPITLLSLGLFIFVINALLFWAVAALVPGFDVGGFWSAVFGAIVYSILTWLVSLALGEHRMRGNFQIHTYRNK